MAVRTWTLASLVVLMAEENRRMLATLLVKMIGSLPFLGPLFEDTSGRSDIHLAVSVSVLQVSNSILIVAGLIAGMIPALRASRLDPVQAIRRK
jgi:ABC-type antimicrobial peptide transport system permease subunit